ALPSAPRDRPAPTPELPPARCLRILQLPKELKRPLVLSEDDQIEITLPPGDSIDAAPRGERWRRPSCRTPSLGLPSCFNLLNLRHTSGSFAGRRRAREKSPANCI